MADISTGMPESVDVFERMEGCTLNQMPATKE